MDDHFGAGEQGQDAETPLRPVSVADARRQVIQDLFGWQLGEAKAVTAAPSAVALGVLVCFEVPGEGVFFEIPADKSEMWRNEIANIFRLGTNPGGGAQARWQAQLGRRCGIS